MNVQQMASLLRPFFASRSGQNKYAGHQLPAADGTYDLGSIGLHWDHIYVDNLVVGVAMGVHDHADAAGGGQLDWDNIWSDAVHDHTAAGEGGQLDHGLAMTAASLNDDDHGAIYPGINQNETISGTWRFTANMSVGAGAAPVATCILYVYNTDNPGNVYYGVYSKARQTGAYDVMGGIFDGQWVCTSSGATKIAYGGLFQATVYAGSGALGTAIGVRGEVITQTGTTLTNGYIFSALSSAIGTGAISGVLYGYHVDDIKAYALARGATNGYAFYSGGGDVFFGGGDEFRQAYDGSNYWTAQVSAAGVVVFDAVGTSASFTFSDEVDIDQPADNAGLTVNGYDDMSAKTIAVYVDSNGIGFLKSNQHMQIQTTGYINLIASTNIVAYLGDAAGARLFKIKDSTTADVWTVDSDGNAEWLTGTAGTDNYAAEMTGWQIAYNGNADLRDVYVNNIDVGVDLSTYRVNSHLIPKTTDTYDIGSSTLLWRKGWLSELDTIIFAELAVSLLGGWFIIGHDAGTVAVDLTDVADTCDFGKAMTVGDFVLMRSSLQVEYFEVGDNVAGTEYKIGKDGSGDRDLDGTGANNWPAGTPFLVLGGSGDGRIELNAYDTSRIQLIRQGAAYNSQTEILRIGDLNGGWGYVAETWGVAIGEYAAAQTSITIDQTNGFRIFNDTTVIAQWTTAGEVILGDDGAAQDWISISAANGVRLYSNNALTIHLQTDGDVLIGSNVTAAATTALTITASSGDLLIGATGVGQGNVLWDRSEGQVLFRGNLTTEAYIDTDGTIAAGGGVVKLNSDGIKIVPDAAYDELRGYTFFNSASEDIGGVEGANNAGIAYVRLVARGTATYDNSSANLISIANTDSDTAYIHITASNGDGTDIDTLYHKDGVTDYISFTGQDYFRIVSNVFISETSNAKMSLGLTVNQLGYDDEAVAIKSSDVGHDMTAYVEADTYGALSKVEALAGGLMVRGFKDEDGVAGHALALQGFLNETADTTKSTAGIGVVSISASITDGGTGAQVVGTNGNLLTVHSYTTTRFILDAEGDSHQDVGTAWTNFSDHPDHELLAALSAGVSRPGDPVRMMFGSLLEQHRPDLEKLKLVTFNDDGHHFVNMSKLTMLLTGGVIQTRQWAESEVERLHRRIDVLECAMLNAGLEIPQQLTV